MVKADDLVFVFGALRSGTTVFRLMLDGHPDIANPGEMDFLFDALRKDETQPGGWRYDETQLRDSRIFRASGLNIDPDLKGLQQLDGFLDQLRRRHQTAVLSINVHRNAQRIARVLPDVRFLHMLRDPRDVARSSIQMGWAGTLYHGVDHWVGSERDWDHAARIIPDQNILTLRYEDLFRDIERELTRVCAFLNVPYDPKLLLYHERSTYAPPDPSLIEQWRRKCDPAELVWLESLAAPLMEARGYALSAPLRSPGAMQKMRLTITNKLGVWRHAQKVYGLGRVLAEKATRYGGFAESNRRIKRSMQDIDISRLK